MVKIEIFNKENFEISCHSCHIRHLLWFRMIYPFFERSLLRAQEVAKLNARSCHTLLSNTPQYIWMNGGIRMLSFLVDYVDSAGVAWHRSFQVDAGRQYRRQAVAAICRRLEAQGCKPMLIAFLHGDYTFEELEEICTNGPSASLSPLRITYELIDMDYIRTGWTNRQVADTGC